MNVLSRDKQIDIIAALSEGLGIRATARLTGTNRETVGKLALRVGAGCAELHDRAMVGLRVARIEMDEAWSFVAKKNKRIRRTENPFAVGDQYVWIAMAGAQKAILSYRVGKRDLDNAHAFCDDLRERVLGVPEISSDALHAYGPAVRAAFGERVHYGQIVKTIAVTDLRKDAAHRYSPAEVVAVARTPITGIPAEISTSYVERQNLSLRMGSRRFTRLTNGFSKKLENHVAAVSLYVAFYNFCRPHETLSTSARHQTTPAMALEITDHVWSVGELLDVALATQPIEPTVTAPDRRRRFRVIEGGRS